MVSVIHQYQSAIGIHMSPPPFFLILFFYQLEPASPSHPSKFPVSYSKFTLAIYFTFGNVYVSMLLSQSIPPCLFSTVPKSLSSMSALLLWPCRQVHQYHLSGFPICVLIYDICLSDISLCVIVGSRSFHLIRTDSNAFFFIAE